MKNTKRAIRRHHHSRIKRKRLRDLKNFRWGNFDDDFFEIRSRKMVNTACPCSCYMCGNPRKYFNEITTQERRHMISYMEFIGSWHELD